MIYGTKRLKVMSLIIAVHVPTGIALSGDSRTTGTTSQQVADPRNSACQITVQTSIVLSEAAEKIFLADGRFGIGTFGDALVNNMPIAHYVGQFLSQPGRTTATSTQKLADDVLRYFRALQPAPRVGLLVIGYDANDPLVIGVDVENNVVKRHNIDPQNQLTYGIVRGGDTAIVDRLLSQPQFNPPFQVMNLQDAVDYSRHLIRSTIDQMRFEPRFPTVGGFIDTMVVTTAGARFLAHKMLTGS